MRPMPYPARLATRGGNLMRPMPHPVRRPLGATHDRDTESTHIHADEWTSRDRPFHDLGSQPGTSWCAVAPAVPALGCRAVAGTTSGTSHPIARPDRHTLPM
jgi:hypothetical protein